MVVDLPVPFAHEILTGEQGPVVQHADAPVVIRVHKGLGQYHRRLFQVIPQAGGQLFAGLHLADTPGKTAVGNLQYHGQFQLVDQSVNLLIVIAEHKGRWRHRYPVGLHQLRQVDLVGAAQDRARVIHHHHALLLRLAGELVGMVIQCGGLADKQTVVLAQAGVGITANLVHPNPQLAAGPDKTLQRRLITGRQRLFLVNQHGQFVAVTAAAARISPDTGIELLQGLGKGIFLGPFQLLQGQRLQRFDGPLLAATELHLQQRTGQLIENLPPQVSQAFLGGMAEVQHQREAIAATALALHGLVQRRFELTEMQAIKRLAAQVIHCSYGRQHPLPASFRQQGTVVAGAEVFIAAAQVDHLHFLVGTDRLLCLQILPGREQMAGGIVGGPVCRVVDQNNNLTHEKP